jgi:hypothetical protein
VKASDDDSCNSQLRRTTFANAEAIWPERTLAIETVQKSFQFEPPNRCAGGSSSTKMLRSIDLISGRLRKRASRHDLPAGEGRRKPQSS